MVWSGQDAPRPRPYGQNDLPAAQRAPDRQHLIDHADRAGYARIDTERARLADQLSELEIAERVLTAS